jgi:hypothetical protein
MGAVPGSGTGVTSAVAAWSWKVSFKRSPSADLPTTSVVPSGAKEPGVSLGRGAGLEHRC